MTSDRIPVEWVTVGSRVRSDDLPDWVNQDDDSSDQQSNSENSTTWIDEALDTGQDSDSGSSIGNAPSQNQNKRLTVRLRRNECPQCGTSTNQGYHPRCKAPIISIDDEWRCAKCGSQARTNITCRDCGASMKSSQVEIPLDMTPTADPSKIEKKVHDETNRQRANHSLGQLDYDKHLSAIAFQHSRDMAQRDFFDHTSPDGDGAADRYREYGHDDRSAGENIGVIHPDKHASPKDAAREVVESWMNSPGHRENILRDRFEREGIGIYLDSDGSMYATQNFY